jgi:two-component system, chemotaxis family, sensor kinase CheA
MSRAHRLPRLGRHGPLVATGLVATFALAVLVPGLRLADSLDDMNAAGRALTDRAREPAALQANLALARDRLENFAFVDAPLGEVRRSVGALDDLLHLLKDDAAGGLVASHPARALERAELSEFEAAWQRYRASLAPLTAPHGLLYSDSEARGSELNEAGRALSAALGRASGPGRAENEAVGRAMARLAATVDERAARLSRELRYLMLGALGGTLLLAVGLGLVLAARARQAARLAEAERQTAAILGGVREGLFLVEPSGRIGAVHSESMTRLFQRGDIAGLPLTELLRPIVAGTTLETAEKFVEVLWSERTRENLVRSINPLQEVEVSFDNGTGGRETRHLDFDFRRVREGERVTALLVSVTDVSQRVALARELAALRSEAAVQAETLFGVVHLDQGQLRAFLAESAVTLKMINAILREPARDGAAFRRKVENILRQVHTLKGEAAALGLGTVESRAHAFEGELKEIESRREIGGADFLPLVVRLDELLGHLNALGALVARAGDGATAVAADGTVPAIDPLLVPPLPELLGNLSATVARRQAKEVRLSTAGLEAVPAALAQPVKNISVQLVRNAIVHGIEPPAARRAAGKAPTGEVRVEFERGTDDRCRLQITDDGAGLSVPRIRAAAVSRGLVSESEAATLEPRAVYGLLFRPGFSTLAEPDEDGGRGVGMSVVAELVRTLGGRVAIASGDGQYTRFTITLPASGRQADAA